MNKSQRTAPEVKPVHMALCTRCADGIRQAYGERALEHERFWSGLCGYCGQEQTVHSVDLFPRLCRAYRQRTGGGERHRAGKA